MAISNFGNTSANREQYFLYLYKKVFPKVAAYISKKGGTFDDAKDVFQDALVVLYERSVINLTKNPINEEAYLMGISKNIWSRKFKSTKILEPIDSKVENFEQVENEYAEVSTQKIITFLESSGQKCMEILKAFYYDNLRVEEIAQLFGYSGTHSATVKKYKCMEKVRETVKEKSLSYEEFIG